ncbi:hypothetical protein [Sinorhizobium sojae]|nr:hypothetical protein [Sinorhizobium sojae]
MDEQFKSFDAHNLHALARRQRSAAVATAWLQTVGWLMRRMLKGERSLARERKAAAACHGC